MDSKGQDIVWKCPMFTFRLDKDGNIWMDSYGLVIV